MSPEKRAAANRANAKRSTGPRSAAGRAKAATNALAHGLCAAGPVLPGEPPAGWEQHRAGVLAALGPVGGLEEALAERVAACLWRLRRAVAYETAVTAAGLEEAADPPDACDDDLDLDPSRTDHRHLKKVEEELADARETLVSWSDTADLLDRLPELADDAAVSGNAVEGAFSDLNGALPTGDEEYFEFEDKAVLVELGVPPDYVKRPFDWPGWTAGAVRRAAGLSAQEFKISSDGLLAGAREDRLKWQQEQKEKVARLEAEARRLAGRVEAARRRAVLRQALPDAATLDKVTRYEAHLSRQMLQALNTLERLQAARAGRDVPPPAAGTLVLDSLPPGGTGVTDG